MLRVVDFTGGGTVVGKLYDSDGTTLLNSVTQTYGSLPVGGLAIRSFGTLDMDTIQVCH